MSLRYAPPTTETDDMDPDANLTEQLSIVDLITHPAAEGTSLKGGLTDRLASLVESLDEWITKGGALPKRWRPAELSDLAHQVVREAKEKADKHRDAMNTLQALSIWMEDNGIQPSLLCRRMMTKVLGPR